MNIFKLWWIKRAFANNRVHIYESLASSLSSQGTRRQELESNTFRRWADRDLARKKSIGHAYRAVQRRLESGKPLSDAMSSFIPVEEMLTIQAGEKGVLHEGEKPKIVIAIESALRQKVAGDEMKAAINGALMEPISQVLMFAITSIFFGAVVWPEQLKTFPMENWPTWSRPFISAQVLIADHWYLIALVGALIVTYYWSLRNWHGRSRQIIEKFPPYSIYRDRMASALLGVLGGLLHGGLTFEESLQRVEARSTPYLRWHIRRMLKAVPESGSDPMKALRTGLFSVPVLDRLDDAAASRDFDETLAHLGREELSSVIKVVKRAATFIGWILLVTVAMLFLYQTAVQVFGVQDAADTFMAGANANIKIAK